MTNTYKPQIQKYIDQTSNTLYDNIDTTKSLYNFDYSIFKILFDSQFNVLYLLKCIRLAFVYVSLHYTTKIFTKMYENAVFDEKKTPPGLWKFTLVFLAFDIGCMIFTMIFLYILNYLFKTDDNTFIIDGKMLSMYFLDYVCDKIVIGLSSILVGGVITNKKYFRYNFEGLRAIRAYKQIIFNISMLNTFIPYFIML